MTNTHFSIVLLASLWLTGACASDGKDVEPHTAATATGCMAPGDPACIIAVDDGSFVRWVGPVTDGLTNGTSSAVVTHSPGKFCMSGTVDSGPLDAGWGAILILGLTVQDEATGLLEAPFDASARGIEQVRFTLDTPPLAGLLPRALQLRSADCKKVPDCSRSFSLTAEILDAGEVTVPLSDFTRADVANTTLERSLLTGFHFSVPTLPGLAYPYDFCLRELAFLDASGREVKP